MPFDVIVIGSGFGGAVTACRLAESGYKVLVLERGRRWDKSNFPRKPEDPWIWDSDAPEKCNGWLELRRFPNMSVATGAAVGGGSLIYANISCEAHPERFQNPAWPHEINYVELKPHYDTVKKVMNVQEVPDNQWTERMKLMKEAAEKSGHGARFRKLELAVAFDPDWTYAKDFARGTAASKSFINQQGAQQGTCVHLGDCDIGCEVHAKNTLDRNYLFLAEKKGAEIRPLHLVETIQPLPGVGYQVSFDRLEHGRRVRGSETARLVIVAAGSLGSTELLLRCKLLFRTLPHISATLGSRWSSNGDFLTPAIYFDRAVEPTKGPTICSVIDMYRDGKPYWIEDGGVPNLTADYIRHQAANPALGFQAKILLEFIQSLMRTTEPFRNIMPWFAQGLDAADGTLSLRPRSLLDPTLELFLDWDIQKSKDTIDQIVAMHKKLSAVTGGVAAVPPSWSLFKELITPHPLGGCNIGRTIADGVVDHRGEVFGYPGLYVIDGAIIPQAIGVNPSRTIAALAERASQIMTAEGK